MTELGWTIADLWRAISSSALLTRPLDEPWQQIPGAIRRLLFRYFYLSDADRAAAHREAQRFMEAWADQQSGKEQVVGLVECLWHEATVFRLQPSLVDEADFIESARTLSLGLRGSAAYADDELRNFAAELIRRDVEFQETVADQRVINWTIAAITTPQSG